jgi:hypothetical protein
MCFGKTWSATALLACVGFQVLLWKRTDWRVRAFIAFLGFKELLQLLLVVAIEQRGECDAFNRVLTTLSWVHISLQPLFVNLLFSAFAPDTPSMRHAFRLVFGLCATFAVFNLFALWETRPAWAHRSQCVASVENSMCRTASCATLGRLHVAYGFRLESADDSSWVPGMFAYQLLSFAPALMLGQWILPLTHFAVLLVNRVVLAPQDMGEAAAMWCVNTPVVLIVVALLTFGAHPPRRRGDRASM